MSAIKSKAVIFPASRSFLRFNQGYFPPRIAMNHNPSFLHGPGSGTKRDSVQSE
jgi:hypothetical protein